MAAPSRAQITAALALPTYQVEVDQGAGYVAVSGAYIASINTKLQTTSNIDNGFAFGTIATAGSTVVIDDSIVIASWQLAKLRVSYGFDTSDKVVAFEGVITKRQRQGRLYTYECAGFDYLIERTKIYTDIFYRRPIATNTTALSIEDPDDGNYRGGLLNVIMFRSGGRPYEQPAYASDPDFKFWYSFDESIVKPRWSWISGENAWEEAYRLVRAAGGQLYQDVDGVLYYQQPLTFGYVASGATLYEFTSNTFQTIQEDASTVENVNTVKASFIERVLQPMQQVYDSSSPYLIPDAEIEFPIVLEMQYPVYQYGDNINSTDIISSKEPVKAVYLDGRDATDDYTDLTVAVDTNEAQRLTLLVDNQTGEPVVITKIVIPGRPITAGSEGIASYTDGEGSELQIEDNMYIQSYAQAYRYIRMVHDFYHENRALITLNGVGYDPDRYLGEVVELTFSEWGLANDRHRIIALDYSNGSLMSVTLVPIEGLVTRDQVYIVGETYVNADVRLVSY
jgi:hypothetical protein